MYARIIDYPKEQSFFLFGPRATGKSTWVRHQFPGALYIDLLQSSHFNRLLAQPDRLEAMIPVDHRDWVILDEVQKIPALLDEVHRLIEKRRLKFIMTGSSPRKLRRGGVNLLGGRALLLRLFPLTAAELGKDFSIRRALETGTLPIAYSSQRPDEVLDSYIQTYLAEEIAQEGLVRRLAPFSRFMESASFSQGSVLNISAVARDAGVPRKTAETYFDILDDLFIAYQIDLFQKRAKRREAAHAKFYFFDAGVFRRLRPTGPLDSDSDVAGPALETLILQELMAMNAYRRLGYRLCYWRSRQWTEVDFVLYGTGGLVAIEVKKTERMRSEDMASLRAFAAEFPQSRRLLLYGGTERVHDAGVEIIPLVEFFSDAEHILGKAHAAKKTR